MTLNNDGLEDDRNNHPEQQDAKQPNAWQAGDDDLNKKDLERNFLFGSDENKPVREGEGMGGQSFGKDNVTPAGNDKNNPSQNAGESNAYLARTEPSEEHPEDSNFTAERQDGEPGGNEQQPDTGDENSDTENDHPHPQNPYEEGTADNE